MSKKSLLIFAILIIVLGCVGLIWWKYEPTQVGEPSGPIASASPSVVPSVAPAQNDLLILEQPLPNQSIQSPLIIKGRARGPWFFEASFPVVLTDWDGLIIAEGVATAEGEWMTEEFVPFSAELEFTTPEYGERGSLTLQKSNPSGLPENDDALEIQITFDR